MGQTEYDLSIVTVVLNDKTGLERTIRSVLKQKSLEIQHIIVDGGSIDGSAVIASENSSIKIESKPDGGIYPAMQRGADLATGKYLIFCNSGDSIFGEDFLQTAIHQLVDSDGEWGFGPIIEHTQRNTFSWVEANDKANCHSILARKDFVPFPSVIFEREFFKSIGGFTNKYKIAGDFQLICKAALKTNPIVFTEPIALFLAGGVSYQKADTAWKEEIEIRTEILNLNRSNRLKQVVKYRIRFLKWKLGKILDFLEVRLLNSKKSWRDKRAPRVPNDYLQYLI